jgi:hypothetical protein
VELEDGVARLRFIDVDLNLYRFASENKQIKFPVICAFKGPCVCRCMSVSVKMRLRL